MKLRVKFSKHGSTKFIGHLDVMRYFQKALRRANIDISYSTGFSPHPIMSFAAPLGVGITSCGEYFDLEVGKISTKSDMIEALNLAMSPGFKILDIVKLEDNAPNAMASVAAAKYRITFNKELTSNIDFKKAVELFNSKESILITKQTKKNEIQIDLRPSVYELYLEDDLLYMMVDASSSGNIKPALVISALYDLYSISMPENFYSLERIDVYGLDENNNRLPLNKFGVDF